MTDLKVDQEFAMDVGFDLDEVYTSDRRKVLIVDDDSDTTALLKHILRSGGYDVISAANGAEALEKLNSNPPDIMLLDLMMPEMDGRAVFEQVRRSSNLPVIVVSALDDKDTIVQCLQAGMDDYLTKPFFFEEVVARVNAVLRRVKKGEYVDRIYFPNLDLTVDMRMKEVRIRGNSILLTPREFAVLAVLAKHSPELVRYETIASEVWGKDSPQARMRIKYLIYLLRRKFQQAAPQMDLLTNIGRQGYKLDAER